MTDSGIDPDAFVDGQAIRADFRTCGYEGQVVEIDRSRSGFAAAGFRIALPERHCARC